MEYNAEEVGIRIQQLRRARKMTQEQLAEQICTSSNNLSRIERGLQSLSINLLIDLASFFCVSTDYIVLGQLTQTDIIKAKLHSVITTLAEVEQKL